MVFFFTIYLPEETLIKIFSEYAVLPASFFVEYNYLPFLSYLFLHLNFQHLLSNMFVLFSVGRAVESEIGSLKESSPDYFVLLLKAQKKIIQLLKDIKANTGGV